MLITAHDSQMNIDFISLSLSLIYLEGVCGVMVIIVENEHCVPNPGRSCLTFT